jgi:hypothetical protein
MLATPTTEALLYRIEGLMMTTHRSYTQNGYTLEIVNDDKGDSPAFAVVDDETGFIVAITWSLTDDDMVTALELVCPVETWFGGGLSR